MLIHHRNSLFTTGNLVVVVGRDRRWWGCGVEVGVGVVGGGVRVGGGGGFLVVCGRGGVTGGLCGVGVKRRWWRSWCVQKLVVGQVVDGETVSVVIGSRVFIVLRLQVLDDE
ncbi:hypothetical protein HanRHA438_Chr12g0552751 [Helianthus annuus]|uniref:Uncharacterized protein n=1 Tax=Helianthus annuus TaxID=4232 RepID=A0A9K3HGL3_HELAN|nr:hypothetical protein HanXRQr2_Chr12g0541711 [Helianthus annuus]KAJ0505296.1 hypothetical protein HanHA89_Chr12g0468971 [Helianthus annuus]KAJ0674973.1 hypothetical protein HanLR1_Chr12g0445981 [Helianthus annuus]KAJ0862715.1 hypothetical protein HanPSC8_Chr12g0521521 [Helianthus annuus]KAJ0866520.1 hypothetical protein HanRHA438_Chr12g0552751 [Helianthus annuus]